MTNNTEKPSETKKRRRFPWKTIGILFVTLAIIVLIYVFYAASFQFISYAQKFAQTSEHLNRLQAEISNTDNQVHQLSEEQNKIINNVKQIQTSSFTREDWRVLEAEFLVKFANNKLQYVNNVAQAILLLQSADQEIRDLNDERLLPIRKALASDIAKLQAVPQLDIPGIYMRLSAVNEQISHLPLVIKQTPAIPAQTISNEKLPWWRRGLEQSWQGLQKIVVVRYSENNKPPLIMPGHQDFLYLNLHAAIEKATWALLNQQPNVYRQSLQQAINWINQYFVADAPETKSVLTNLTELQQIDVHPSIPDISDSLKTFHEYFASRDVEKTKSVDTAQ